MRILIFGKNGQVGFELTKTLHGLGEIVSLTSSECNLADERQIRQTMYKIAPQIIINAAAYTAVDKAEAEQDLAMAINATALKIIAEEAKKLSALIIHYSTDYVFNGEKVGAYQEDDKASPISFYGKSKLAGENYLINLISSPNKYFIFRISWVVGAHGNNFAKTVLRLAKERENINIVADQYGAPTSAKLIANVTKTIIKKYIISLSQPSLLSINYGIYHLSGCGVTTWFDYAKVIVEKARAYGFPLKLILEKIKPITSAEYPTAATRPKNSQLDCTKIKSHFGISLPNWKVGVNEVLEEILGQ